MTRLVLLGLVGSLLFAQPNAEEEAARLLAEAEEAPDHQVEPLARRALSLLARLPSPESDSLHTLQQGQALDLLAYGLAHRGRIDSALFWCDSAYRLLYRHGHYAKAAEVKGNLAYYLHQQGQIVAALNAHKEVAQLAQSQGNLPLLFYTYNNLGGLFSEIGLQDSAAAFYQRALTLSLQLKDDRLRAFALNNLAVLYETQNLLPYAQKYTREALAIRIALRDSSTLPNNFSNLGRLYHRQEQYDSAAYYYGQAYSVAALLGNPAAQATAASNLAALYTQRQAWDSAAHYLRIGQQLRETLSPNERFKAYRAWLGFYRQLAEEVPSQRQGAFPKGLYWLNQAQTLLKSGSVYDTDALLNFYREAHAFYAALGDYAKAYQAYQRFVEVRDSLINRRAQQKAIESRYQYEWLQEEEKLQREMLRQQLLAEEKQRRQRLWIGFFAVLALLLAGGGMWLFRLYQKVRAQRDLISQQKAALEESHAIISEQHEELRKSLRYAKRIQQAILPDTATLQSLPFPQALWYQPQSEVGGDFYWLRPLGNDQYLVVLGDCTGHGAPGGFMTVLSIALLERALEDEGPLHLPQLALYLHESYLRFLHAERDHGVYDGMEGIFALMDLRNQQVSLLGAGLPTWWISPQGEFQELPDSGPGLGDVRFAAASLSWKVYTLPLSGRLILASDGARDQMSPARKKWGRKAWKAALQATAPLPPQAALEKLQTEWEAFRKDFPQLDDVTVWLIDLTPPSNQVA